MRKKILVLLIILITALGWSQSKTLDNILSFKVKNTGAIADANNEIDGYYFFYEVDRINRKEREYAINLLDQNLNNVATKKIVQSKKTKLLSSVFNNQATIFAFFNHKNLEFKIMGYDKKANPIEEKVIILEKKVSNYIRAVNAQGVLANPLFPVDNKGVLINLPQFNKNRFAYKVKYYPTDGGKEWTYISKNKEKHHHTVKPIVANENFVVLIDINYKNFRKKSFNTIVLDINTGEELFTKEFDLSNPRLISNSFITKEGNIVFLGQYYEPEAKIHKDESLGLFSEIYDRSGNLLFENKISWAEDISQKLEVKRGSKIKKLGYIFFHEIIRAPDGSYYAIGEQYKKTANAAGIAAGVLSAALGGGVSTAGYTQLTIDDAFIFKFDKDFKLLDIEVFEKGKSRVPNIYDFGSPQLNAFQIKAIGGFDYVYSQIDSENNRFYANFIDYERLKDELNKFVFKTIIYDEGEFSEDKIPLKTLSKNFRVLPGKLGHVLLLEYDRKKKSIDLRLEKLNIE